jgi:hypothetical protein
LTQANIRVAIWLAEAKFYQVGLGIVAVQTDFKIGRRFHNIQYCPG